VAAQLLESRSRIDVSDLLARVQAPTLVIHGRGDAICPIAEGRFLASGIKNAQFVELDSANHILLEGEPAWDRFRDAVLGFMGLGVRGDVDPAFASLSSREREILALVTEGLGNAAIGERLSISEKTVRNHISSVFDKLGVWTRAQAIVFARDRGFGA
jgi:DNA-binding NarL/FixJ family response regulator